MNSTLKTSLLALSISSILAACGGGSSGTTDTTTSVTSSGAITEFGSIYVNGVRYQTTASKVVRGDGSLIDDNPSTDDLKLIVGEGNIVKVRGTKTDDSNGVATTITVDDELVGTIEAGSITDATFVVLGQTISISPTTVIDDSIHGDGSGLDKPFGDLGVTLASLFSDGMSVEISGLPSQTGIQATRVEDVNSTTAGTDTTTGIDEIKGFVKNLDTVNNQFNINALTIDYSSISTTAPSLANDDFVEVHGTVSGGVLSASSIEQEDLDDLLDDDFNEGEVEIEGVIERITATPGSIAGIIVINGIEIPVADVSKYTVGIKVEVKTRLQNGSFVNTVIKDESEDTIRIQDLVTGTTGNTAGSSVTTRLGLNVMPSDRSRLELNDSDNPTVANFLTGVQDGDYIEARGFRMNSQIIWTRIEVESDSKQECRLRGSVGASPSNPTFTIEGVTVTTDSSTQFRDASGLLIADAATFFGQLAEGAIVQAKSASNGTACQDGNLNPAKEVSFEPADDVLENNSGDDNGTGGNDDLADNELKGAVSNVTASTFDIAGETVTVEGSTMIDDSLIEEALGGELPADKAFSDAGASLSQLLKTDGTIYVVTVDRSNGVVATAIEDF